MRDELLNIKPPRANECGILNLNCHDERGSHWTAWFKRGENRYYFDSYGARPPIEVLKYLKTAREYKLDKPVVKCNAVIVQHDESVECGALSLYVIYHLTKGKPFSDIIGSLQSLYRSKLAKTHPLKLEL